MKFFIQVALSSQPLYPKSHDSGKLQLIAGKTIIASQNHWIRVATSIKNFKKYLIWKQQEGGEKILLMAKLQPCN